MTQLQILNQQYVLSLDSLDLSLLSQFVHKPFNEQKLLWSKSYIDGESTYYQVNIDSEEYQDEECCFVPSETHKCHICNIDIPKKYFKQHIESSLHQSYTVLIEKVLENVSKQINIYIDSMHSNVQRNEYYCKVCSKVVLQEDKQKHNKSKYHLQSVENQKLIDVFIEMYVGKKEVETTIDEEIESNNNIKVDKDNNKHISYLLDTDGDQTSEDESEIEHTKELNINNVTYEHNIPISSNMYECLSSSSSDSAIEFDKVFNTRNELANFEPYLHEVITKYKLQFKIPMIENDSIVIVTPKGFKEMIEIKSFHGFKNINSFLYCQVCKNWVDNPSHHIRNELHVRNIIKPVNDNFLRDVILNENWSHCLVCNAMIIKGSCHAEHIDEKYSGTTASQLTDIPMNPVPDITPKMTYSDVCKKRIDTDDISCSEDNTKMSKHSSVMELVNTDSTKIATEDDELYCEVCEVVIRNNKTEVHNKGKRHTKKLSILNNNRSEFTNCNQDAINTTNTEVNLPCKSIPRVKELEKHINKFTTEEKLLAYKRQMTQFGTNELKCMVCDVKVHNLSKDIIKHIEGLKHKKFMNALLLITKIEIKSINQFYCKLCKCLIDDFIDHIIQDVKHKIQFQAIFKTELREFIYDDPLNGDPLACEYRKVYEDMLKRNYINRLDDNSSYCNVCSITLLRINEIDHMLSGWHKSSLKSNTS